MKEIPASSIGASLLGSALEGKIISVYTGAINIQNPDGILFSILADESQMSDYGVVARELFSRDDEWLNLDTFIGKKVKRSGSRVMLGESVCINTAHAKVYSGKIPPCMAKPDMAGLESIFKKLAKKEGLSPVVTHEKFNIYAKAAMSVLDRIKVPLNMDLSPLIGMGPGFTPSGDDFISGVLLYLNMHKPLIGEAGDIVDLRKLKDSIGRTSSGGKTLLTLVLGGSFPSYLKSFGLSVCAEDNPGRLVKSVSLALEHGSTSGSDALTGFLWIAKYL